mmetsp:Transcript_11184/g.25043  ORF Transcript_11184/g.25043 Transcript_11184/m.25043 type:complete len:84 (+) Transcript_11184:167-418(+)
MAPTLEWPRGGRVALCLLRSTMCRLHSRVPMRETMRQLSQLLKLLSPVILLAGPVGGDTLLQVHHMLNINKSLSPQMSCRLRT